MKKLLLLNFLITSSFVTSSAFAEEKIQDMSDPLAVYTQAGIGISDTGLNLKVGNSYDTGDPNTMAMNILEIKGFGADLLGLDGNDSIDNVRYRNFNLDLANGRGAQVDINWNFNSDIGSASYSFIQALPKFGALELYPMIGFGLTISDTAKIQGEENPIGSVGYAIPSTFMVVGTYSKITITDDFWLNYNPMYISTVNSNAYMSARMDGLHHEFAASYQLNPRQNIRLFANYTDSDINDEKLSFRLEFNHQF